ncbi:DUF1178 family protein [Methylobacterium sp. Leaf466]|uniref:DUF1178 family protein n=1 Tax=Methylobacterium sp. Leaf466 TaxID=1736386 RepID=UPI0006F5CE89|nr:DUF1178 family protein [Methylobacterium sp. Leaf466]KQT90338.1 hypothetical protein ASG59_00595 [Methylobacterium sp. Leaf466]
MIRYTLACEAGHGFESWFPSSEAYDEQVARGLVTCPLCGSAEVGKGMMAPAIARGGRATPPSEVPAAAVPMQPQSGPVALSAEPDRRLRAMMRAIREHVVKTADDVGDRFPEEARRIHYGEVDSRPIYGEASPQEARDLIEEGIAVAPLPIAPDDRN